MNEYGFAPITDEDIEDVRKLVDNWWRTRWGAEMPPSTCRGLAKDVLRLLDKLEEVTKERDNLKEQLEAAFATGTNTREEFENNPCTICGSPPGVHCPHD